MRERASERAGKRGRERARVGRAPKSARDRERASERERERDAEVPEEKKKRKTEKKRKKRRNKRGLEVQGERGQCYNQGVPVSGFHCGRCTSFAPPSCHSVMLRFSVVPHAHANVFFPHTGVPGVSPKSQPRTGAGKCTLPNLLTPALWEQDHPDRPGMLTVLRGWHDAQRTAAYAPRHCFVITSFFFFFFYPFKPCFCFGVCIFAFQAARFLSCAQ